MIDPERIHVLNDAPTADGRYVLYWMQASQRAAFNPALEYAISQANEMAQPLVVCFGLMDDYPEANARHYYFMVEGLSDVAARLEERGIQFVVCRGRPPEVALELAKQASLLVCDRGYLRHQRRWRDEVADGATCRVVQVEGDVVVPIEEVSDKQEFAARTIRPKIQKLVGRYLQPMRLTKPKVSSLSLKLSIDRARLLNVMDVEKTVDGLKLDRSVGRSAFLRGGYKAAKSQLTQFAAEHLAQYTEKRRDLSSYNTSLLAAYLHFGQISPVEIALAVQNAGAPAADRDAFLEELIVRRELAMNFVFFQPNYDHFDGLPAWAIKTLREHSRDRRTHVYSRQELEQAQTHDRYWNAAQRQMTRTGYMHNMMRMYWGKKFLEWKETPEQAFADALYLNNKYFLCGRDPASYANIGWLFGLHDRPWVQRDVFGTIRYMNAAGLERKFDMDAYIRLVET